MFATFCTIVKGRVTSLACLVSVNNSTNKSIMNDNIYTTRQTSTTAYMVYKHVTWSKREGLNQCGMHEIL
jgi:hypothetical protein